MKITGKDLKNLIKGTGLSQEEVAKKLNMSRQTLHNKLLAPSDEFIQLVSSKLKLGLQNVNIHSISEARPVQGSNVKSIPVYLMSATAGAVEATNDYKELPAYTITVPGYEDCSFGMQVFGHSMYPTIENGVLVLCRKVEKAMILWGEIYVLITNDYRMVKRLQRSDKRGHILCTSDNDEDRKNGTRRYEDIDQEVDKINSLYLVKGIIKKTQS